jgi:ribokinase
MGRNLDNEVVVIGAVNVDSIVTVDHRPAAGARWRAPSPRRRPGGKGANQAAAAARAGAAVSFIGAVGTDPDGAGQIAELERAGVAVAHIQAIEGVPTGSAFITVTPDGDNSIVVAAGANSELPPDDAVSALATAVGRRAVVVLQTEVPPPVIDAAARLCMQQGVRFVLNNGPAAALAAATLAGADPIVVNEHEAHEVCGAAPRRSSGELARAVRAATAARSAVVTLGADGVLVSTPEQDIAMPAVPAIEVVDTTGAGDAFVGTLAARLALGDDLIAAVREATHAASLAVTWPGARPAADAPATTVARSVRGSE